MFKQSLQDQIPFVGKFSKDFYSHQILGIIWKICFYRHTNLIFAMKIRKKNRMLETQQHKSCNLIINMWSTSEFMKYKIKIEGTIWRIFFLPNFKGGNKILGGKKKILNAFDGFLFRLNECFTKLQLYKTFYFTLIQIR